MVTSETTKRIVRSLEEQSWKIRCEEVLATQRDADQNFNNEN